jgi:hypothetical protein
VSGACAKLGVGATRVDKCEDAGGPLSCPAGLASWFPSSVLLAPDDRASIGKCVATEKKAGGEVPASIRLRWEYVYDNGTFMCDASPDSASLTSCLCDVIEVSNDRLMEYWKEVAAKHREVDCEFSVTVDVTVDVKTCEGR